MRYVRRLDAVVGLLGAGVRASTALKASALFCSVMSRDTPIISGRRFSTGTSDFEVLTMRRSPPCAETYSSMNSMRSPVRGGSRSSRRKCSASLGLRKRLVIGISERLRRGDMRKLLESPVPVEITELVAAVLDEEIDRNVVEDAVKDGVHLLDPCFRVACRRVISRPKNQTIARSLKWS